MRHHRMLLTECRGTARRDGLPFPFMGHHRINHFNIVLHALDKQPLLYRMSSFRRIHCDARAIAASAAGA